MPNNRCAKRHFLPNDLACQTTFCAKRPFVHFAGPKKFRNRKSNMKSIAGPKTYAQKFGRKVWQKISAPYLIFRPETQSPEISIPGMRNPRKSQAPASQSPESQSPEISIPGNLSPRKPCLLRSGALLLRSGADMLRFL